MSRARLSQERSRQRRDALLEAAVRVFAEGGIRAVTHRAVAAEAGLPLAATTYYFASIQELVRDAIRHHVTSWIGSLQQLTDAPLDLADLADLGDTARVIDVVFTARGSAAAGLELSLYLHAARDPELRGEASAALDALEGFMAKVLQRAGVPGPEQLVAAITAQLAGVAIRRQSREDEQAEAQYLALALRNLVAAHVLGEPAVDEICRDVSARAAATR